MDKTQKTRFTTDTYISMVIGLVVVLGIGLVAYNYFSSRQTKLATQTQEQKQQEEAQSTALPKTYTVAKGDTLWSISEKYIKSGYNYVDIQKANNLTDADTIVVGQSLVIPSVAPIQVGQIAAASTTAPKTYTVVSGDTLWSIAEKQYQSGYKWVEIAQASHLNDPNLIFAGNVLTLP